MCKMTGVACGHKDKFTRFLRLVDKSSVVQFFSTGLVQKSGFSAFCAHELPGRLEVPGVQGKDKMNRLWSRFSREGLPG